MGETLKIFALILLPVLAGMAFRARLPSAAVVLVFNFICFVVAFDN
jgi:hypothetical protein